MNKTDTRWDDPDFDDEGRIDVEHYPLPPGLVEVWDEIVAENQPKRVKKARARHVKTGFGHRDNLKPGMTLKLRKGDCRPDEAHEVSVLEGGRFGWNGFEFPNGNQLLKAVTGRDPHRLTVRRYFSLGGERSSTLVDELRDALLGKAIVAKRQNTVYLSGELATAGIPDHMIEVGSDSDKLELTVEDATELLHHLRGE